MDRLKSIIMGHENFGLTKVLLENVKLKVADLYLPRKPALETEIETKHEGLSSTTVDIISAAHTRRRFEANVGEITRKRTELPHAGGSKIRSRDRELHIPARARFPLVGYHRAPPLLLRTRALRAAQGAGPNPVLRAHTAQLPLHFASALALFIWVALK